MNFADIDFIFIFLPLVVLLHGLTKGMLRNAVLFVGSLVFYAFAVGGRYSWVLLLLFSAAVNYLFGRSVSRCEGKGRKVVLFTGVAYNVITLCLYKYADAWLTPLLPALSGAVGTLSPSSEILLPLGLSFYTFKNISYLNEVYSKKVEAEPSFIRYGTYLTMFPQISMGPIQTYESLKDSLNERKVTLAGIQAGAMEFILGLGLKCIFAGRLGAVWNGIETIGYDGISTPLAWLGIIAFSLQLYFDFYGYSLMASGIGEMLGYKTPKNFDYPYLATSMSDFWRRWHMTLGAWFKENVYFPLGGNRCGKARLFFNLLAVWLLTGIWHGDTLTFLFWGFFLFVIVAVEKTGVLNKVTQHKVWSHVYMIPLILLSWTIFKLPTLGDLGVYLGRMFPFFTETPAYVSTTDWVKYVKGMGGILLVLGLVFCTPLPRRLYEKVKSKTPIVVPILLAIFWYSVYLSACGANDPFLYFNF